MIMAGLEPGLRMGTVRPMGATRRHPDWIPTGESDVASFGEQLRQAREARNMTLQDIAAATKIGARTLQALEEERFEQLPGGIFNKGFVRSYARCVGLDEEKAVRAYLELTRSRQEEEANLATMATQVEASRRAAARSSVWNPATFVTVLALLVAAGLGYVWWHEHRQHVREQAQEAVATQPPPEVAAPVPAAAPAPPVVANPPAVSATALPEAAPAAPVSLVVTANARAWISVISDGKKVETITLDPNLPDLHTRTYTANEKLLLVLGNPAGVEVSYNGKPTGPLGRAGTRQAFMFTPQGFEKKVEEKKRIEKAAPTRTDDSTL